MIKVKRLQDGKYAIEETSTGSVKSVTHIEKDVLERAILTLKQDIADKQGLLAYKENWIKEIKKL